MVIPAELAALERLAIWAGEFGRSTGLSSNLLFAIELCIEEAVANIIMYSGAAEHQQDVAVELEQTGDEVVATIEDSGRLFDPTAVPSRPYPASLEEAAVGRLGIHLIRSFTAGMHYERREGRNRLTLRFGPARVA
jgi:anti-sigma regulatory factor (Ser/Thr protein kinase)